MKLIKPTYEILTPINREDILTSLEKYGRTCYKSENKITPSSAGRFVNNIVKSGHLSVIEHCSLTVRFICDRGVTHEMVRHRLASYSQESTRYCNYSKEVTFILPCWFEEIKEGIYKIDAQYINNLTPERLWFNGMLESELTYKSLLINGWKPQQARSVLPNSLKTEIVVTANLREWLHVFKLRCSSKAHPQIREVMVPLRVELQQSLPEIFGEANG